MQKEITALDYWILQEETNYPFKLYHADFSACPDSEHRWLALLLALSQNHSQVRSHVKNIDIVAGNLEHKNLPTQKTLGLQKKAVLLPSRVPLFAHRVGFGIPDVALAVTGMLAGAICAPTTQRELPITVRPLINDTEYISQQLQIEIKIHKKSLKQDTMLGMLFAPTIMAAQRKALAVLLETEQVLKTAPSYLHALIAHLEKLEIPHDAQMIHKNSAEYVHKRYTHRTY